MEDLSLPVALQESGEVDRNKNKLITLKDNNIMTEGELKEKMFALVEISVA